MSLHSATGADRVAEALRAAGCRYAFGIPGGEVLALVDALTRHGIPPVLVKHENAGGFMAEGVWHATGTTPLLYATLGPGMANAFNVVANASQDRVPLIFITGCVDAAEAESYTHQVFDHQATLRPLVKASFRATAATAGHVTREALRIAHSGRPGPVHIDLPIGVAEGPTREAPGPATWQAPAHPAPDTAQLAQARALVDASQRPLILAGLDAVNEQASAELLALAEALGAPVVTTYKGKGLIPETHPLSLGGAGLSPKADRLLLPLLAESDCLILAGYDPIEMRINWRNPWPQDAPVIDLVAEAIPHGMHASRHLITGDLKASLAALTPRRSRPGWPSGEPAKARAALRQAFAVPDHWGPHQIFATLRDILPTETIASADSGAHRILFSQIWESYGPRRLIQSSGLCTMGCAVPLAAGYRFAAPGQPVLAVVGDAGLEMGLGELATLRDLRLPVIICVLVDSSLALIELKQRGLQKPNAAVDFGETDFPAVAAALGGHGIWIDDVETLQRDLKAALTRDDRFTLLACRIPRQAYDGTF